RELRTLKQERTRVANRMNGLLANQGLWLPPGTNIGAAAKTVRLWDGSPVPAALRARLEREWEHAQFLRTRIRELERARQRAIAHGHGEALAKVRQLLRLRAVGPGSAWVYVNEFFGWRRFRNRKEVGAAAGLTPTPYQSGDGHREMRQDSSTASQSPVAILLGHRFSTMISRRSASSSSERLY